MKVAPGDEDTMSMSTAKSKAEEEKEENLRNSKAKIKKVRLGCLFAFLITSIAFFIVFLLQTLIPAFDGEVTNQTKEDWKNIYKDTFSAFASHSCKEYEQNLDSYVCKEYQLMSWDDNKFEFKQSGIKNSFSSQTPIYKHSTENPNIYNATYLTKVKIAGQEYEVNLPLIQNFKIKTISQSCVGTYHGFWNSGDHSCYVHKYLQTICLVLDMSSNPYKLSFEEECSKPSQFHYQSMGNADIGNVNNEIELLLYSAQDPNIVKAHLINEENSRTADQICLFIVGLVGFTILFLTLIKKILERRNWKEDEEEEKELLPNPEDIEQSMKEKSIDHLKFYQD